MGLFAAGWIAIRESLNRVYTKQVTRAPGSGPQPGARIDREVGEDGAAVERRGNNERTRIFVLHPMV
jgi:hypothetical protein